MTSNVLVVIAVTTGQVVVVLLCLSPLIAGVWATHSSSRNDRSLAAWRDANQRDAELEDLRKRLTQLETRIETIQSHIELSGILDRLTEVEVDVALLKDDVKFSEDR